MMNSPKRAEQRTQEELCEEIDRLRSQLRRSKEQLAERECMLRVARNDLTQALAATKQGIIFLDAALCIRDISPFVSQLVEVRPEHIGDPVTTHSVLCGTGEASDKLRSVMVDGCAQHWVIDSPAVQMVRAYPYLANDTIDGVILVLVAQPEISRSQPTTDQFRFMADKSIDATVVVDGAARVIYANHAMSERLGYSVEELCKMTVPEFDTQHSMEAYYQVLRVATEQGGAIFESGHMRKDGSQFPVEVAVTYVEPGGQPHLYCTIRDISERKQDNRERILLQNAIAAVENGIFICDASKEDLPISFANNGFYKMTGYDKADVLGRPHSFLHGAATNSETAEKVRLAMRQEEPCRVLIENYTKEGISIWNDLYVTPVREDGGEVTHFVVVLNDVTERILVGESVRENERTIRLLLDSTAEGIFGIDADGVCTFCNRSAVKMLAFDREEELIGKKMERVVWPDDAADRSLGRAIRQPEIEQQEELFKKQDGSELPVQLWSHPMFQDDEYIGAVITFFDDTERRDREQELRDTRDEARQANEAKTRFLANMSHELRTPLASIIGFAEIIEQEFDDIELHEKLGTIKRNGDYLLRLLGDLLDLSRIESGYLRTNTEAVDLQELLIDLLHMMRLRASENGAQLEFRLRNPLPRTINTDAARLRQILINLIANAIKFSPRGRVELNVETVLIEDLLHLQVRIKDNGIGISKDKLKQMFQPFMQADASISERFGGTGLGLSITKRLVHVLKGDIQIESEMGQGTEVLVQVPIEPCGESADLELEKKLATDGEGDAQDRQVNLAGFKVLIADDMRDIRFVAQHFLTKAGCQVEVAENGAEALAAIKAARASRAPYHLVLMDIQMPIMGGVEATQQIRRQGDRTPIIALTADAMKGTREVLLEAGFDEYLTKPLDASRLLSAAQRLIHRSA